VITLEAFGPLDVRDASGQPLTALLSQSKRSALLAYLVLAHPDELYRRDHLLAVFWPELDQRHGRNALSQSLSFLRRELGEGVLVTRGAEEIGVDPTAIGSDVRAFEEAVAAEDWSAALEAYGGDLLEGLHVTGAAPFTDWVDRERERLREAASGAAWKLAHAKIAAGELTEAERVAQRALMLVPTDESPVRGFIEALAGAGDRAAALRFYERFREVLAEELEVEPAPETVAVMEAVRERTEAVEVATGSGGVGHGPWRAGSAPGLGGAPGRREGDGRRLRLSRPTVAVALPLLLVAIGYGLSRGVRPATLFGTGKASPYDQVVVGDLAAPFDPGLGRVTSELLRIALDQSDVVRPVAPAEIGGALRLMERDPALPLDEEAARQVAARLGAPLLLVGEMKQVGETFIVTLRLEAVTTGELFGRFGADAGSGEALVEALDGLGGRVRARIGESRSSIRRSPPLEQVTTPSLEALRLYTEAVRVREVEGRALDAIPLLERAMEIDTAFATAYRKLAITLGNQYIQPSRQEALMEKAHAHRDRLSEFDRLEVESANAWRNLSPDADECTVWGTHAALHEAYMRRHPDDPRPLHNYGLYLTFLTRWPEAIAAYRQAIVLMGERELTYGNLFSALMRNGEHEAAREELSEWRQRFPDSPRTFRAAAWLAMAAEDYAAADSIYGAWADGYGAAWDPLFSQGRVDALRGRMREAEAHYRKGVLAYRRGGGGGMVTARELDWELLRLVAVGDTAGALAASSSVLDATPPTDPAPAWVWPVAGEVFAMGGSILRAQEMLDSMAGRWRNSYYTRLLQAWVALAEGEPDQALALVSAAKIGCYHYLFDPRWFSLVRGRAHEAAARPDSAVVDYDAYVGAVEFLDSDARPWIFLFDTLERLGRLNEQLGHDAEAAMYYERAAELWKDADPELQPRVQRLRERAAALRDGATPTSSETAATGRAPPASGHTGEPAP